jgi:GTP-binding protein
MKLPQVAIIGRPNVGKSTLFNRISKTRKAVTAEESGITRDSHIIRAEWAGVTFWLVDTGGFVPKTSDKIEVAIREQVLFAVEGSDSLILVVDVETGITDADLQIVETLRRSGKPVFVAVNKVDNLEREWDVGVFLKLGMGHPFSLSALSGTGVGDLLDAVVDAFTFTVDANQTLDEGLMLAVVGRPNVGKSSLVNAILGQERLMVAEEPGTTRDAIDTRIIYHGKPITLIDTAGLRRRSQITEGVEFFSALRTEQALTRCDVAVVLIDASQGLTQQDVRVLQQAIQRGAGLLLVVNKWDLVEKDHMTFSQWEKEIRGRIPTLSYVPILSVSAKTRQRVFQVIERAQVIALERQKRIPTGQLNTFVIDLVKRQSPPAIQGRDIRIPFITQASSTPPHIVIFSNHPDLIPPHYLRFIERRFRETFGFDGVPVRFSIKRK